MAREEYPRGWSLIEEKVDPALYCDIDMFRRNPHKIAYVRPACGRLSEVGAESEIVSRDFMGGLMSIGFTGLLPCRVAIDITLLACFMMLKGAIDNGRTVAYRSDLMRVVEELDLSEIDRIHLFGFQPKHARFRIPIFGIEGLPR